ncbi:hypothetical protein [Thalassovita sp.]|jgi:hypothetical protein|uniref:hypothetical protein n=1 Tax=Thalassovita sp. TaxID=1979401 RepID=UPI003B5C169A
MSLIRPEAAKRLSRWAEPSAALALVALGLWWALTSFGVLKWLGWALAAVGAVFLFLGIRRARFWRGAGGVGHVEVNEGAISYFSPEGGMVLPIDALSQISLTGEGRDRQWRLLAQGFYPLSIPVDANGAQALYDVFASLPGIQMESLLRALEKPAENSGKNDVVIWSRNLNALH